MQTVTYRGPSGEYHVKRGGKRYVLPAGTATEVPDDVAKSLSETEGHDFSVAAPKSSGGGKSTSSKE